MHPLHQEFQELKSFSGAPGDFWKRLLSAMTRLVDAQSATLMRCPNLTTGQTWRAMAKEKGGVSAFEGGWKVLAEQALENGYAADDDQVAVRMEAGSESIAVALIQLLDGGDGEQAGLLLAAYADLPGSYLKNQNSDAGEQRAARFATVLDVGLTIQASEKFAEASMRLCNELTSRFQSDRTSLGWLHGNHVKVEAVSHSEKLEKRAEILRELEIVMEEALDQDDEIVFPPQEGATQITRQHSNFAERQLSGHVVSVPLRADKKPVGVITVERKSGGFGNDEVEVLRLIGDFLGPMLLESEFRSRWLGSRWATGFRRSAAKLIGFEHTWAKLGAVFFLSLIVFLCVFKIEHRIRAPFVLKSTATAQIPAPFDGFISGVHFRVGDRVGKGTNLVTLDTSDLVLQEAETVAEAQRFQGEARTAEAAGRPALMQIARFQGEQSKARQEIVRHRLEQAEVAAPFDGIVIEGDLQERIAAPVQRGELLVRIVRLDGLYVELKIDERDIAYLKDGAASRFAFTSLPEEKYHGALEPMDPVPESTQTGTVFKLRADISDDPAQWWRPGMTGICKVDAGERSLMWLLTHRTVDFLRMFFWL